MLFVATADFNIEFLIFLILQYYTQTKYSYVLILKLLHEHV